MNKLRPYQASGGAGESGMTDESMAGLENAISTPADTAGLDRQFGFRKTRTAAKYQPFSTGC